MVIIINTNVLSLVALLLRIVTTSNTVGIFVSAQPPACEDFLQERIDCYDTDGPCELLPIPASAFGPQPDPDKGYLIQELREGVYAIGEGSYYMMAALSTTKSNTTYEIAIFDFPEGSFVIRDPTFGNVTGSLITNALDELVFEIYNLTVDDIEEVTMVYSHQHMDHIGAAAIVYDHIMETWMPDDLEIVALPGVKEEFEERTQAGFFSFRAPSPTILVHEETDILRVGSDLTFTLTAVTGHSDNKDLVIFLEKDEETDSPAIMMYVDVVFPGWAPFFSFAITTDLFKFLESHQFLIEDFDLGDDGIFIGGHLSRLGGINDIQMSYDFGQAVLAGALVGLQTADFNAAVANSGIADPTSRNIGNTWHLFDEYFKDVVKVCAKQVVAEWGCKLATVDVVVDSHCRFAQSYWRVDF